MKKESLETETLWIVSTRHVSKDDVEILNEPCGGLVSHTLPYGWLVWSELSDEEGEDYMSEALQKLLETARKFKFEWVMIDRDGPEIDELEKFDW